MDKIKYWLFFFMASMIAPFHFKPKKCYVINKDKCKIWNCKYHYKNNRYDECQK